MKSLFLHAYFLSILISSLSYASRNTIYEQHNLHYLFKGSKIKSDKVKARGGAFYTLRKSKPMERNPLILPQGKPVFLPLNQFQKEKELAASVLKTLQKKPERPNTMRKLIIPKHYGTAFYIGENLAFTAAHVLDKDQSDYQEACQNLQLTTSTNQFLTCKRVLHCNNELDFCLIELQSDTLSSSHWLRNTSPLKLSFIDPVEQVSHEPIFTTIGNAGGFGLQASSGFGHRVLLNKYPKLILTFATLIQGNSGGPLFNDQYQVVGIVNNESPNKESESSFGASASLYYVIENIFEEKPQLYQRLIDQKILPKFFQLF